MEVKNYFATDTQGNVLGSAQVYLYLAGTTTLATGVQNINGAALANPFTSQNNGLVQFKAPDNDYDLRVVKPGREFTIRIQCFDGVAFIENINGIVDDALQENVSTLSAPHKIPRGDASGKIDMGWLSGELVSAEDLANATDPAKGAALVGFLSPLALAVGRQVRDKVSDSISLKDFGCKGDGITDDTAAYIRAIVNAGMIGHALYAPKGDYILDGVIPISAAGPRIYGDGQRNTNFIFLNGGFSIDQTGLTGIRRPVKFTDLSILTRTSKVDVAISAIGNPALRYGQGVLLTNVEINGESSSNTWKKHLSLTRCGMSVIDGCMLSGGGTSKANRVGTSIELIGSKDVKIINGAIINFDDAVFCTNDAEGIVVSNNHIIAGIRGFLSDSNVGNYFAIYDNHFAVGQEGIILGSGTGTTGSNHCHVHDNFMIPWPAPDTDLSEWIAITSYSSFNLFHSNQVLKTGVSFNCTGVALKNNGTRSAQYNTINGNTWNAITYGVTIEAGCTANRVNLNHRVGLNRVNELIDSGSNTQFLGQDSDGAVGTWSTLKLHKPGVSGQKELRFHPSGADIPDASIIVPVGGTGVTGSASMTILASQLNMPKSVFSGPVNLPSYTLATLPNAALFPNALIMVSDATGGSKVCRSNSSVWQILNTTTAVN